MREIFKTTQIINERKRNNVNDKQNHAERKLKQDPKMNPPESAKEHINNVLNIILNGQEDKECQSQD